MAGMAPTEVTSQNEHHRTRWNLTILLTMYGGYVAFMLCRNTLIAASPAMIADPQLGIDIETYGQVMSWHSAGAIAGKVVTGLGADALGGRLMFLLALALTAASNIAFGLVSSVPLFKLFNFTGQFSKAGGWPAMAKIIGHWYPPANHGRVWSIISTSSRVGTMTALFLIGSLLVVGSWRTAFLVTAVITLAVTTVGYFLLKERPQDVGLAPLAWVMGGLLLCGTACVYLLSIYPSLQLTESARTPTVVATLFTFGLTIATAYYIPMSVFAVSFGGPHSGFLISLIDIFGYAAALVFTYFGGTLAQDYGWTAFLNVLLAIAILATITMTTFLYLDARREVRIKHK